MARLILILSIIANPLSAKLIYVRFHLGQTDSGEIELHADPNLKVWEFQQRLFKNPGDSQRFVLANLGPDGYQALERDKRLGEFGDNPSIAVEFHLFRKGASEIQEPPKDAGE